MNQIKDAKDLVGKTITAIIDTHDGQNRIWISFTDNSFVVIEVADYSKGFSYESYRPVIEDWDMNKTNIELCQLGLITAEEHLQAVKDEERMEEIRREESEKKRKKEAEEYELKIFNELKKKYNA